MNTDIYNLDAPYPKGAPFEENNEDLMAKSLLQKQIEQAGIQHPNYDASTTALNPDRPLTDIPVPAPRYKQSLDQLLSKQDSLAANLPIQKEDTSKWGLIASPELASHFELLQLGGLINLPSAFFEPKQSSSAPLLAPLTEMTLLDMSDIYKAFNQYPNLTRYGFSGDTNNPKKSEKPNSYVTDKTQADQTNSATKNADKTSKASTAQSIKKASINQLSDDQSTVDNVSAIEVFNEVPEMINDIFAPNWETILYPERFDNGVDSLATDILACSTAVHILKQCQTRKTVNRRRTVAQICQHMRSYVLSQCNIHPQFENQYRQIRLFEGHVIMAASYLGMDVVHAKQHSTATSKNAQGMTSDNVGQAIYINISSQSSLLTRYPNISDYYINGWS